MSVRFEVSYFISRELLLLVDTTSEWLDAVRGEPIQLMLVIGMILHSFKSW
jgi:hypothetical protein